MKYGRLPWFEPAELDVEQRKYYDRLASGPRGRSMIMDDEGRLFGAFNARLLDPPVGTAIQELGAALRFGANLAPREREVAILEVARAERCNYEWNSHAAAAREAGVTDVELDQILTGRPAPTLSREEAKVRTVVQALTAERDLADDVFEDAVAVMGTVKLFDVISIVGHYQHTALALRVWRVPVREGQSAVFE